MRFMVVLLSMTMAMAGAGPATAQTAASRGKDQSPAPYVITGTVVSSADKSPVTHCRLSVSQGGRSDYRANFAYVGRFAARNSDTYYCDEHGHFSIPVGAAGSWHLTASARGFVTQLYEEHENFFSAIVLTAAKPTDNVEFLLSPEASITGVVVDEAGEPVRGAQITLQKIPPPGPDGKKAVSAPAGTGGITDDRGVYELLRVAPGDYRLSVRAHLWYAVSGASDSQTQVDPSLDLVYPVLWFPGTDDPQRAETLTLHPGDTRQADFHLSPIPSIHLRILLPPEAATQNGRPANFFPMVQQIIPGGGQIPAPVTMHSSSQGQMDIDGLAPGTYQIRAAGPNATGLGGTVELTAGGTRTLDLNAASDQAKVTMHLEGISDSDSGGRPVQAMLADPDTGRPVADTFRNGGGPGGLRRERGETDHALEVSPGRYQVVLQGRPNVYLTGITAKGAEVMGSYVTVPAGDSTLTLRVAAGRAKLSGVASREGKPVVGAMVLLVPTTLDDPGSLRTMVQEQTNTDGSFELPDVIPGQYILAVIDRGWEINWSDRSTLLRYLPQGVPVDLAQGANVKQNVTAMEP